ncbi:peptidase inhibitor family I36 protein [Streptomyces albogriseolus]|uniref:peptidase inhibitor family I36 protein n=2 Tax=Streptomyces TaxID=1883 RepID=UPI002256D951|nr:peptidase inhibitor family I36 protein [Streptomyces viridodiastaticus]MCX4566305.1 peptidase inhibitor family I36 protein [Streptomyces viridodiastaticus]
MGMRRKLGSLGITVAATAGLVVGVAPQSQASASLTCPDYEPYCMVFFYNTGYAGSRTVFRGFDHYSLNGYTFLGEGAGKGQAVKNNAASAGNLAAYSVEIYYNSNLAGACDSIPPYGKAYRLVNTYNNNASFGYGRYDGNCYKF